jgi:Dolichyl-phosphate-mannose-protein mannosyltransferase
MSRLTTPMSRLTTDRLLRRLPRRLPRDRVLVALALLLGVGLLLRIYFLFVWSPALTGFSDTGVYFQDATQGARAADGVLATLWTNPGRVVGYSMFLRVLHAITPHLILVTIVQHILGLLVAVLLFLAVRRCGGPRGLGLVPAAIIALGGDELFLEHAALSEALFIFLLSVTLYCAVRASQGGARWAALAGLSAGLGVWVRVAGVAIVAVIALWLAFSAGRPTRRTIAVGVLSLVVSLASIGVYEEWRHAASGLSGLTTNGNWNLYGRVAPWADCTKFTPPPGTQALCETTPPSQRLRPCAEAYEGTGLCRLGSAYYVFGASSPGVRLLGSSFEISKYPHAMSLLRQFSEAAILGQPLDYLHAVWLDAIRLVDSNLRSYGEYSADQMISFLLGGFPQNSGKNAFVESWQGPLYPGDPPPHRGDIAPLKKWERLTRVDGPWMLILLALCLAGPWLLAGRARSGMVLFAVSALVLLFFPIFTTGFEYRYVIPAYGPLLAAGALAGWGLAVRLRPLVLRIRPKRARRLGDQDTNSPIAPPPSHVGPPR